MDGTAARFRLLGPVEVRAGGRPVDVGAARQRCVLAALLLDANDSVPVDQLVERVWGGRALPKHPRRAAQIYVSLLRGALSGIDEVQIVRRAAGYSIQVDERLIDVHRFRALTERAQRGQGGDAAAFYEQALGLWRGEAFGELDTPWLSDARAALDQERRSAERELTDYQLGQGLHATLLARLSSWVREHPLDERLVGQSMLALFRSGRQADALEEYRRVRERLANELGADPSQPLQALYQRILVGDPALLFRPAPGTSVQPAPQPTAQPAPRQLPAAPRWFTGRHAELEALLSQSERAGTEGVVSIASIDGMAGVGKTALAVHTAHRLAEKFPDGQLFLDLRGYTQGSEPRTPDGALDWLLRALGVPPQQIPEDVEQRAALYRQRLSGTRTLIVLDNALDETQLRPLLPGSAGCLVLVTSRRRLKGLDDATAVSLDVLPRDDALALLRTVAGPARVPERDSVPAEIAELCGRLPLALRIAAALVRHRPAWSLEQLAELLRDQLRRVSALSDGERDLGAVFDLSYRSLGDAQRGLFRRLALVPGPDTDAYVAAALADTDPDAAGALLDSLFDHNLLMQHAPGRYWMHDLVRLHARALADQDPAAEREAALERLLDYYQHTASRAEDLVTRFPGLTSAGRAPAHAPGLPDADAAWTWLRAERHNVLAALAHAAVRDRPHRSIALTAGLASLMRTDGSWPQAIGLHADAVRAAESVADRSARARALIPLGDLRGATGDIPGAARDLQEAADVCRRSGDQAALASALARLGQLRGLAGEHQQAIRDLRESLEVYRGIEEARGRANALTMLGQIRGMTGDLPGAARDLREALDVSRELGDRPGQANALTRLGLVQRRTGEYPQAVRDLREALALSRELGDRSGQANALACLGEVYRAAGDHAASLRELNAAMQLFRSLGDLLGQANVLMTQGRIRGLAGDRPAALRDLREALDLYQRIGARGNRAMALNCYAALIAETGDGAGAMALHREALLLARELLQPENEAGAQEGIGECHLHAGAVASGAAHLQQALNIFQRLSMAPDVDRITARLARLEPAGSAP